MRLHSASQQGNRRRVGDTSGLEKTGMEAGRYIFAGGGTGGHLFPGIAVATALQRLTPAAEITFFTTHRDLDRQLLSRTSFQRVVQSVRPFSSRPWRWPGFWFHWRRSVFRARQFLLEHTPRAVLGLGGYAAGPAVVAASSLGIRTAILNPDAIPGRANRYLARRSALVVLQWDCSRKSFNDRTICITLGCPIRDGFDDLDAGAARARFGLDQQRPVLVVTGASQGARTVNLAMTQVWPDFLRAHPEWQLLHLTGSADESTVRHAYASAGVAANVVAFTHEMADALSAADAVVSRAGASTLAELTVVGKPSILLPYPYHRDQHQLANARVLADAGAALIVEDRRAPHANRDRLRKALERVADAPTRNTMAGAARKLARPNAARDVAQWLANEDRMAERGRSR